MSENSDLIRKLWSVTYDLRAVSKLRGIEYTIPLLGLIFLKYLNYKFERARKELEKLKSRSSKKKRELHRSDYQAYGVTYLPEKSRFSYLLKLPEGSNIGKAINEAMKRIEEVNQDFRGVLPMTYHRFENSLLYELLKTFGSIPAKVEDDFFSKLFEYFLDNFALIEGQKGGEFYTPTSIAKLIVEIIEPIHGRVFDPACGAGGIFIQSAKFIEELRKNPSEVISIYGQERIPQVVSLCKMNLVIHGLTGDIRAGDSYYEVIHDSIGKFDFVMANPPFNVSKVDKQRIIDERRFALGIPTVDNANYLWIQIIYSALNERGRAGFVMTNLAGDARYSEKDIRRKLIENKVVDVVISISPNFFYNTSIPCTLWFIDKKKSDEDRGNSILFIDARQIFKQVHRTQREFSPEQIEFIANIVRLYRGEEVVTKRGSEVLLKEQQLTKEYVDVPGLCKVATIDEITKQDYSLNPARYVKSVFVTDYELLNFLVDNPDRILEKSRILTQQYQTPVGRIDALVMDEKDTLWILELKTRLDDEQLDQGLRYYDWLVQNQDEVIKKLKHKLIKIDRFQNIGIILVAPSFSTNVSRTAKYLNIPIHLLSYIAFRSFDDSIEIKVGKDFSRLEIPPLDITLVVMTYMLQMRGIEPSLEKIGRALEGLYNPNEIYNEAILLSKRGILLTGVTGDNEHSVRISSETTNLAKELYELYWKILQVLVER